MYSTLRYVFYVLSVLLAVALGGCVTESSGTTQSSVQPSATAPATTDGTPSTTETVSAIVVSTNNDSDLYGDKNITVPTNYTAPDNAKLLTANEILEALVGNTAWYPTSTGGLEYCSPNGTCKGKNAFNSWSGTWAVKGPVVCFLYPNLSSSPRCRVVARGESGKLDFYELSGHIKYKGVAILKGNQLS